jgi:hypothetical protein
MTLTKPQTLVTLTVRVEADADVDPDTIWPDGAPDVVTAEAVAEVIQRGELDQLLGDLVDEGPRVVTVLVSAPNPHWRPEPALIPTHAPERVRRTHTEVIR